MFRYRKHEKKQKDQLKLEMLKLMAEENDEKFLEYDRATDTIVLSEIRNGEFSIIETVNNFVSKADMVLERIYEEDQENFRQEIRKSLAQPGGNEFDVRYILPEIGPRWYHFFLMSISDENGYVTNFVAHMLNVQEEKEAQEKMRFRAERDSLSGVYNHATYAQICTELANETEDGLVYVMIDIDKFKQVNDTSGHHAGDQVIQFVGQTLEIIVNGRGYAGRIGGDEFSVCLYGIESREEALSRCVYIKSALNQYMNTVPFTVSMGATYSAGRKLSFQELYFEADEAVYFAKESGRNQLVFKDEIQKKKQEKFQEDKREYALTEEEIAQDQKLEYIAIIDPITKDILYMNEAGRNALGIPLDTVRNMHCYELFKDCDKPCETCSLHANHVQILEGESAVGLEKYIPHGKFIIQSKQLMWKGNSARSISFMDVNDAEHVELCMEAEIESNETFTKCWNIIMSANSGDTEYEKVLRVLTEYYDAECCAIITKDGDKYHEVFEYHKNAGQAVAEGLRVSVSEGLLERCEFLLDDEDFMRPRHIDERLAESPEIAAELKKRFIYNTLGIALRKYGEIIGVFMVLNPHHNLSDYAILSKLAVFFSTDLVRKKLTDNKSYEEDHDILTRMWSREFFNTIWQKEYFPILKSGMGIFTGDIFHLKEINRQLGYTYGNDCLIELAELFRRVFTGYSMFRYDDDRLMVICHNVDKKQFQKMVDYATELITDLDFEVSHGASWKAEPLLIEAIEEAEEYLEIYRGHLERENMAAQKLAKKIEREVIEQIGEGNFRMYLQPKVRLLDNTTVGAEGLIRLYQPEKGLIPPGVFIPVLEQQNEIHIIDLFILRRAFQFQKAAKDAGRRIVPISVNFSKNTLIYPNLISYIQEQCEMYGSPEGMIRIEITETISNMDHIEVSNIAQKLHEMGFSISMDDFGTKYSNLAVLTQFDFDTVKIDRSMIVDIAENPKNQIVLKYNISMLKDLGMEVVIEGVETEEQVRVLKELGCEVAQGFYFGKPEPEEQFYKLFM